MLVGLAHEGDRGIRRAVAENEATPAAALADLATDEDVYVRRLVAANLHTDYRTLLVLAADSDGETKRMAIANTSFKYDKLAEAALVDVHVKNAQHAEGGISSPADEIRKFHDLLEIGAITSEEFEQAKARILAAM